MIYFVCKLGVCTGADVCSRPMGSSDRDLDALTKKVLH